MPLWRQVEYHPLWFNPDKIMGLSGREDEPGPRGKGVTRGEALGSTNGPALRTESLMVKGDRTVADPESVDRGLFRDAEEFRDEVCQCIRWAMKLKGCSGKRSVWRSPKDRGLFVS